MVSNDNIKLISTFVIFFCMGLILTFSFIIYYEISSAKNGCEKLDGEYTLKSFNHFCDNKQFFKYSDGTWDFDREMSSNYTIVFPN